MIQKTADFNGTGGLNKAFLGVGYQTNRNCWCGCKL
jgi:hypothetical protein